jgi:hypothetical protein
MTVEPKQSVIIGDVLMYPQDSINPYMDIITLVHKAKGGVWDNGLKGVKDLDVHGVGVDHDLGPSAIVLAILSIALAIGLTT